MVGARPFLIAPYYHHVRALDDLIYLKLDWGIISRFLNNFAKTEYVYIIADNCIIYRSIKKIISLRNFSKVFSHFYYSFTFYVLPYM